jgi:hypothetical protein
MFFVKAAPAQRSYQELIIDYHNDASTLSAIDVDLKDVLSRLACKTNINVYFQQSLQKNITSGIICVTPGNTIYHQDLKYPCQVVKGLSGKGYP